MAKTPLHEPDYRPQFSGHETFPLRYGWLKKSHDAVAASESTKDNRGVFSSDDAIARFGVGKNMVGSMRHWALSADIIADQQGSTLIHTTPLGDRLFGVSGFDPYMESPNSLWIIHWKLASRPMKTTWYWVFNQFASATFERESLVSGLVKLARERSWARVAETTIKADVACFIRTYAAQAQPNQSNIDDSLESPLAELGLIKSVGRRDGFRLVRGGKPSLGSGVFLFALLEFWSQQGEASTMSFETLAHAPGSPGRVFLLDEEELASRLASLELETNGALRWSETAGLKQVVRDTKKRLKDPLDYVERDFAPSQQEAA
jgi:hypothetical protein